MRSLRLLLLVIPFMLFLPGEGLCGGKDAGNPCGQLRNSLVQMERLHGGWADGMFKSSGACVIHGGWTS